MALILNDELNKYYKVIGGRDLFFFFGGAEADMGPRQNERMHIVMERFFRTKEATRAALHFIE